jgi:hypothetical protein
VSPGERVSAFPSERESSRRGEPCPGERRGSTARRARLSAQSSLLAPPAASRFAGRLALPRARGRAAGAASPARGNAGDRLPGTVACRPSHPWLAPPAAKVARQGGWPSLDRAVAARRARHRAGPRPGRGSPASDWRLSERAGNTQPAASGAGRVRGVTLPEGRLRRGTQQEGSGTARDVVPVVNTAPAEPDPGVAPARWALGSFQYNGQPTAGQVRFPG